jgi:uncharacterized protein (TIGR02145 family)
MKHLLILLGFICMCCVVYAQDSKPKSKATTKPTVITKPPAAAKPMTRTTTSSVTTDSNYGSVTDIDGNVYKTVKIGNQIWMAENLKTSHYNDGTQIPNITDGNKWVYLTTGAYCYYDNEYKNNTIYGKLYNWYAVNTGKLAPKGWHIPTDAEWLILTTFLGGETIAGGKMKSTKYWKLPNIGATNNSGFNCLPAGYRTHIYGLYNSIGYCCYFWSTTEGNIYPAWYRSLRNTNSNTIRDLDNKESGYSVRCIKD